jgi:hypothetical protein
MVVVLIRSNHISGVKVSVHADVVTSNQYNYHQHSLSTTLTACTLTFTTLMWLLLINTTTIDISGVKVSVHATSVVDSEC